MHVLRPQLPFFDLAFLLLGQLAENFPEVLPQLPVRRLAVELRNEHDVAFALPLGVT